MTGSRMFWMAVQALFVVLLTLPAILEPASPGKANNIFGMFVIAIVVVGFFTGLIIATKDRVIRHFRGIPEPPKIEIGKPLYQPAPSKKMTTRRTASLIAHVAAIAGLGYAMHLYSPKELLLTITVPLAFVIVLVGSSLFHRVKEHATGRKPDGAYVQPDGRSIEILPPDRAG